MSCPFVRTTDEDSSRFSNGTTNETEPVTYASYLELEKILGGQHPASAKVQGCGGVHDEMLFIVTHQAFELWFKQILFELDSIRKLLESGKRESLLTALCRTNRVNEILKVISQQFGILETMTAQSFADFRTYLGTASGFQSCQFRLIEIALGVDEEARIRHNGQHFAESLDECERDKIREAASENSLLEVVNSWLETLPPQSNFVERLTECVRRLRDKPKKSEHESNLLRRASRTVECQRQMNEKYKSGGGKLSYGAMQGALTVLLHRDRYRSAFQMLHSLMEIDTRFNKLRYNHACMVRKMLGFQSGTGGSSGYHYLRSTCTDRYRVFGDIVRLSTLDIPNELADQLCKDEEAR